MEILVLIGKDIAITIAGMAVFTMFFSFLAYTYVNMLR
ncbi:hypothetical protein M670_03651 [Schinkia azotoformans MEV2011]|uniref:Uncharacterized protein n=1 Tax=Schinkia azotoformans MEV2011 TaxID=1348973 RepID=A0A072NUZ1_SCHAZ|nr:hypothetical protein M670_03651 [Schinkia azotoformans MEV2011]